MSDFIAVPPARLDATVLEALLQEFASRDGTDYGEQELPMSQKTGALRRQLEAGELLILYDSDSEQWDLLPREQAELLLHS